MGRDRTGATFTEVVVAMGIGAVLAPLALVAAGGYQTSQKAGQYPVEVNRIFVATRAFLKDELHLPQLPYGQSAGNPQDIERWRTYYRPPAGLRQAQTQLLPDGLSYEVARNHTPSGVATTYFPGKIVLHGTWCDRFDGNSQATCSYNVPFY